MNNFSHATKAAETALESQGSAMRENDAYMESIQAKLSQLNSTFQDFANNVISSDLVKGILDLANGLLQFANTDLGQIVTQIVLLTGLGWGATSLTKALGIFKVGIQQFKVLGQVAGAAGAAGGITSVADAFAALSLAGGAALPIILGVASALVVGGVLWKATEDSRKSFEELNAEIESNATTLETNKQRLEELNSTPWYDRTSEIENEIAKIEAANKELEKQIQYYKDLSIEKARKVADASYDVYDESSGYHVGGFAGAVYGKDKVYSSREDLAESLYSIYGSDSKYAEWLVNNIEEIGKAATLSGQELDEYLTKAVLDYNQALRSGNEPSKETITLYNKNKDTIVELVDSYKFLQANGEILTESQQALLDAVNATSEAYEVATENTEKTTNALKLNAEQVDAIKSKYPELAESITKVGDSYYLAKDAAVGAVSGLVNENGKISQSAKETAKQTLTHLEAIVEGYKAVAELSTKEYVINPTEENFEKLKQASGLVYQAEKAMDELAAAIAKSEKEGYDSDGTYKPTSSSSSVKRYTDQALEQFKSLQKDIEHQLAIGEITEEEYYAKLEELVRQYKVNATAHMKEYGLNVNKINQNMYQYEEDIYKGRAKLAEELAAKQKQAAEEREQAEREALEQQRSDYESAINYIISKIDERINKLNQQKSEIEKFYDDQIKALQDTNDELERQIQYEQLLNNLAQAQDKKLYVYSNGQFQYMQDVEAISAAQAELDAYKRDEALRQEVENLNRLKDQAIATIDAQIQAWERYRDEWSNIVNQYEESQNRLLAVQMLGIDTEKANWELRLANVQNFVSKYNSIMSGLSSGSFAGGITKKSSASGGGYYFDKGSGGGGGWTAAELRESNPATATNGYYDPNKDYSKAIEAAKASGASQDVISRLEGERENKIKDKYGGKEPTMTGSNKTYSEVSKNKGITSSTSTRKRYASGTTNAVGGLSLVGEQGPELRVLGQGDGVIPADVTKNLWDWGKISPKNMGGNTNHIFNIDNLTLPNVSDAKSLVAGLKNLAYQRAYKRA